MSSRRHFLKTGMVLGGASLVGGGLYYNKISHTRALAAQLVYFLDYPELALSVGQGLLQADKALSDISLDQLLGNVLKSINISREQLGNLTRSELLEALHQHVNDDFANEQIVLANGWLLSKTEANLCSLLAMIS